MAGSILPVVLFLCSFCDILVPHSLRTFKE
jgi:hypothetical protein